jgi:hypothetical protein
MTFFDIAKPLAERGIPVSIAREKTKVAFLHGWESSATTNLEQVTKWNDEFPNGNVVCVAKSQPGGFCYFEIDKANFHQDIQEQTGQKFPDTLIVSSSPGKGKGHFYFRSTPASIAFQKSCGKAYVSIKDENGKESASFRMHNAYIVGPGSIKDNGDVYTIKNNAPIAECPDWLVSWVASRVENKKTGHAELDDESTIIEGSRNSALASVLGKARQVLAMDKEQLYEYGLSVNRKRCSPPLSEQEVRTISNSMGRYEITIAPPVVMGGITLGQSIAIVEQEKPERLIIKAVPYPIFPDPDWLFGGCSIYEGLVRPICKANPSRRPEFMALPALTILLNYIGTKVRIEYKGLIPSIYLVLIARKGRLFKSSSIQDAIEYLKEVGIVDYAHAGTRNAEGKSLVWSAGSPEGIGIEMARTNCKNSILFFDELSTLSKKASIEGSNLGPAISTMYESGLFANTVKGKKEQYSHSPGTYCASIIAATTDKNFISTMAPIITSAQGNDERFMYLLQPEVLPKSVPQMLVNTKDRSAETRKRIDKAIQKGVYSIDGDMTRLEHLSEINNRVEQRCEKWALALCVDLGRDSIDDDILERAHAICKYELAVKKYLFIPETTTREGGIQAEILQLLQRSGGSIMERDLHRIMHPERHGTSLWWQVYSGLIRGGWIIEDGQGTRGSPKQIILLRVPESEED